MPKNTVRQSTSVVTEDGRWLSSSAPAAPEVRSGVYTSGGLCSACLTGIWPASMLRQAQFVCGDCRWLYRTLLAKTGVADALTISREDSRDRSEAHREHRLREAFDRAAAEGLQFDPQRTVRELPRAVYSVYVPSDDTARVRRFADWLAVIGPDVARIRTTVLADVPHWTAAYSEQMESARTAQARTQLADALSEASRSIARIREAVDAVVELERVR